MTASAIAALALALATGMQDGGRPATTGTMPMAGERMPAPAACPATPEPLPADYRGWAAAAPVTAGADVAGAPMLTVGRAARVTLADTATIRWTRPPGHVPAAGSKGGLIALTVPAAARYRVALGAGAWIDVLRDGAEIPSVAHAHGPACTPVRKTVDFDLSPGRYLVQLSGNAAATIDAMVLRLAS